jgi:DNA invertase Pin-like site-specific DNA recombinase
MISFAFYGRVSTEDQQDPESSRSWQLTRSRALIEPRGGQIVAEFFDIDRSRSIPWQRRPQAAALLAELKNAARGFEAVVIGEPHRAFYGNQYGLTFPIFDHYGVPLWVPEVGGPIDPANEAHDLVMSVFGGMSKGERNRVKIRVRTAMAAQAQIEGRFLGGRPPYGYLIVDAGPHPNPAKAADGKRLHKLALDPQTVRIVQRIFAEFIGGRGIFAIAEGLTRDGIPSPSAHDPARNTHRTGIAWSKGAVRAILTNPRYTGYQVWNRQRTDEVLLDVENVALGHTAKMRWNPSDKWVFSEQIAHPAIISTEDFELAQATLAGRGSKTQHKQHRRCRSYVLRGVVLCGLCGRRMSGKWNNGQAYYLCRFPAEYALANKIDHPKSVYLREADVLGHLDHWLAELFGPAGIDTTLSQLAEQAALLQDPAALARAEGARRRLAEYDAEINQYRASLKAGADPAVIGPWIAETQARKVAAQAEIRAATGQHHMSRNDIATIVAALGDLARVVAEADPADKSEIYAQLGLMLTYQPGKRLVEATIKPGQNMRKGVVSEAGLHQVANTSWPRSSCSTAAPNDGGGSNHQVVDCRSRYRRRHGRCGGLVRARLRLDPYARRNRVDGSSHPANCGRAHLGEFHGHAQLRAAKRSRSRPREMAARLGHRGNPLRERRPWARPRCGRGGSGRVACCGPSRLLRTAHDDHPREPANG